MARTAIVIVCACVLSTCGGCFGYLMGLSDREVRRVRQVVAELEAKNAQLLEENVALRKRIEVLEGRIPADSAERSPDAHVSTSTEGVAEVPCRD